MSTKPVAAQRLGILRENTLGALAYVTFLPALVFLLLDPYRRSAFVRFHSVQCMLLWLVGVIVGALLRLVNLLIVMIPVVGPLLAVVLMMIAALAAFFIWITLLVKAYQGQKLRLPVVGEFAKRLSA